MPLPPAPSQRATLLSSAAFDKDQRPQNLSAKTGSKSSTLQDASREPAKVTTEALVEAPSIQVETKRPAKKPRSVQNAQTPPVPQSEASAAEHSAEITHKKSSSSPVRGTKTKNPDPPSCLSSTPMS